MALFITIILVILVLVGIYFLGRYDEGRYFRRGGLEGIVETFLTGLLVLLRIIFFLAIICAIIFGIYGLVIAVM